MNLIAKLGIVVGVLLLLVGGGAVLWKGDRTKPVEAIVPSEKLTESVPDSTTEVQQDPRFERLSDGRSVLVEGRQILLKLHAADSSPEADLDAVDAVFGLYRWAYKENPEGGDNRELVAALTGENPHKLIFIEPNHPALSESGELLDRWGSPYIFHKLSDQIIDVSSNGPDKRQWSSDDLTLGYTESYRAASSP